MKVLLITSEFPPHLGGVGRSAHRLALGLTRAGHTVRVFTANWEGDPVEERAIYASADGIEVFTFPRGWFKAEGFGAGWPWISLRAREFEPDLVHVYQVRRCGYAGIACARLLGAPVVVSGRGRDVTRGDLAVARGGPVGPRERRRGDRGRE